MLAGPLGSSPARMAVPPHVRLSVQSMSPAAYASFANLPQPCITYIATVSTCQTPALVKSRAKQALTSMPGQASMHTHVMPVLAVCHVCSGSWALLPKIIAKQPRQ